MSYVLAVDVGTSFTAAAVARFSPGTTPIPESLPLGLRGSAVPSVVYYPEEGPVLVGEAAERRGLDSPGRLIREFKRRIGDSVPFSVGTLSLPPEDVYATMARWVADRAAEREGEAPSRIILTHPAAWGSHRTSVVRDALAAKGLDNITLLPEPEAAALHYASQVRVEDGSVVAVYDLGGGTFDTAVLRKAGSNRFDMLGRPEGIEDLGGADFDAAVFRYVASSTDGALAGLDTGDPGVLAALARLRRECVEAKEALSADSEASISVLLPGVQQQVRLVRSEFEALIEEPLRDTVDALEQSLAQLDLEPADLTAVLLIGGSSRIPLVAQLISARLDRPIAVDADPKSSICLGAVVSAVLAQPAGAQPAAEPAAAESVGAAGPDTGDLQAPPRLASWSRKSTTAAGAVAAHGPGHPHHGGAHAPKPTVRLTAVAAAAALLTVLTATAAQSPEGFGNLTAMFVPQAGAAAPEGKAGTGTGGTASGAGGTGAGAPGQSQAPLAGIEAGVDRAANKAAANKKAGLEVEASPTSRPSASAGKDTAASAATGSDAGKESGTAATGTGSAVPGTGPGTSGTPTGDPTGTGTVEPTPGTVQPTPGPDPTTQEPAPDPTTDPPAPEPTTDPPAPEPTTDPPAPEPTTEPPAPEPPAPEPTTEPPAPEPVTETAPAPTEPAVI